MRTLVLSDRPEIVELISRRQRLGLDRYDEMWEGTYHVAPEAGFEHAFVQSRIQALLVPLADKLGLVATGPFNLGTGKDNFRVPDFGVHVAQLRATWVPTAVGVGEILSPGDETWEKFPFYAGRGVEEVYVVNPAAHTVRVFLRRDATSYVESDASSRLGVSAGELADIRWPD